MPTSNPSALIEFRSRVALSSEMILLIEQLNTPNASTDLKRKIAVLSTAVQVQFFAAVEQAFRNALANAYAAIAIDRPRTHQLKSYWRVRTVETLLLEDLRQGVIFRNHIGKIAENLSINGRLSQPQFNGARFPFPGNVNTEKIRELFVKLEISFSPPAAARAGTDLDALCQIRNTSVHGEERFEFFGKEPRVMSEEFERITVFIEWAIAEIESYVVNARFREATSA